MLPSSGYFQSVPCPFYNNGLCERHHCQYRHVKKEAFGKNSYSNLGDESLASNTADNGRKSDLLKMVDIAIQKAQQDVERNKAALDAVRYSSGLNDSGKTLFPVNYTPTPVSICTFQTEMPANKSSVVPEYHPTPIAQLKKLQKLSEKRYDPVNNFSTPVPQMKRKRIEYDPTEVKVNTENIVSADHASKRPKSSEVQANLPNTLTVDNNSISSPDEGDLSAEFSDDSVDDENVATSKEKEIISNENKSTSDVISDEKIIISSTVSSNAASTIDEYNVVDKILLESKKCKEIITNTSSYTKNISNKTINKPENIPSKVQRTKNITESRRKDANVDKSTKSKDDDKIESKSENDTKPSKIDNAEIKSEKCKTSKAEDKIENKVENNVKSSVSDTTLGKSSKSENKVENNTTSPIINIKAEEDSNISKSKLESKSNTSKCSKQINEPKLDSAKVAKVKEKSETKTSSESVKKISEINSKGKKTIEKSETLSKQKHPKSNKVGLETVCPSKTKQKSAKRDAFPKEVANKSKKSELEKTENLKDDNCSKSGTSEKQKSEKRKLIPPSKEITGISVPRDNITNKINRPSKKVKHENCFSDKNSSKYPNKIHTKEKTFDEPSSKNYVSSIQTSKIVKCKSKDNSNVSTSKNNTTKDEKHTTSQEQRKQIKEAETSEDEAFPVCDIGYDMDIDTDLDEHDTYEECWRIFNESQSASNVEEASPPKKVHQDNASKEHELPVSSKKRIAHQPNIVRATPCISATRLSPGQVMQNRFLKLQEMHCKAAKEDEKKVPSAFLNHLSQATESGKKRIAHVPNASLLAAAAQKQKLLNRSTVVTPAPTVAMTSTKGEKRIAHIPAVARNNRPIIPAEYGSKVPCNIRQRYLDRFIDECLKFCDTEDEAYQLALKEENTAFNRSANKSVYLNVAVNTLKKLRDKTSDNLGSDVSSDSDTKKKPISSGLNKVVSHEYVLGGPKAVTTSFSIAKRKPVKPEENEIKGAKLYNFLKPYIMSEEELDENGFPRQHPTIHGQAIILNPRQKNQSTNNPLERICCRCQKKYRVTVKGKYVREEECVYHWGRLWKRRIAGVIDSRYSCCQGDSQSEGCCMAQGHVFEDYDSNNLKGYVKTLEKTPPRDGDYGVYALDCEMCYSTGGIELTRITVIAPDLKPIYETMVKPENPVIDYNTRFSGITEDHLTGVTTTLGDVQAVLLSLFSSRTILIGHSLESDFKALKLIHRTVVDTSVVFPHKMGLPYKRALRTLMAEYLSKIIQNSVDGHDSQEDALSCMELMLWKIKEDIKKANR